MFKPYITEVTQGHNCFINPSRNDLGTMYRQA